MTILFVLFLCETSSAVQATEVADVADYRGLFYVVMEFAGNAQELQYMRDHGLRDMGLDFGSLWDKFKTAVTDFGDAVYKAVYGVYEAINIKVSQAYVKVNEYLDAAATLMTDFVRNTRKDFTGAYGVVSGFIKDKVNAAVKVAGLYLDNLKEKALGVAKEFKKYNFQIFSNNFGAGDILADIINFADLVSRNALQAGNFTVYYGDAVLFVVFETTFDIVETAIITTLRKFRDNALKFMIFDVGLPILLGVVLTGAPILAPLLVATLGDEMISGLVMAFIKKAVDLFFVKVFEKRPPTVEETVACYFSTRFGKLVLLVMEVIISSLLGDKIGQTLTSNATLSERTTFRGKAQSTAIIEEVHNKTEALTGTLITLLDYMLGLVQRILFPKGDDYASQIDENNCFPHLKDITFEDVMNVLMKLTYKPHK